MSVIDSVKPYESFSLWGTQAVLNTKTDDESIPKKIVRITLSEIAFAGLALFGVIETIFRGVIFACVKAISLVHPDKADFRNYIVLDALKYFTFSTIGTAQATAALMGNLLPDRIAEPLYASIANNTAKAVLCCTCEADERTPSGTPVSWLSA